MGVSSSAWGSRAGVTVAINHSHTQTQAYPSRADISLAAEPEAHYVRVVTHETSNEDGPREFRSYRIVDGNVTEEDLS